jgi:large subunit ribosomal protein L6
MEIERKEVFNMSKIGKKPILIPNGVKVDIDSTTNEVSIKGKEIELKRTFDKRIKINIADGKINVERSSEDKEIKSLHGLTRTLIANMINGVEKSFIKRLELNGVGYKASLDNGKLLINLGYTHPVVFDAVPGIEYSLPAETIIEVKGADKELVGLVAAKIRHSRNPDPYKGKGVKYSDEVLRKKAGKALGKAGGK